MVPGNVSVPSEALAFFCEAVQKSLTLEKRKSCETVNGNFKVAVARHLIGSEVRTLICMSEWGERLSIVKERDPRHYIVSFDLTSVKSLSLCRTPWCLVFSQCAPVYDVVSVIDRTTLLCARLVVYWGCFTAGSCLATTFT